MIVLPRSIRALAHEASNGELAWRVPDAAHAIHALAEAGLAIMGGEAWVVRPPYTLAMPTLRTGESAVIHWNTVGRRADEEWGSFVRRTADESLVAVADLDVEQIVVPDMVPDLHYAIAFVTEVEYNTFT